MNASLISISQFSAHQKYNVITFLPLVLFEQFRFFLNLYFLIMALSQFIPDIRIGYLYTYWGPLGFVLTVTICREAVDDLRRHKRDREVNSQKYMRLVGPNVPPELVPSSKLKVRRVIQYAIIEYTYNFFTFAGRRSDYC